MSGRSCWRPAGSAWTRSATGSCWDTRGSGRSGCGRWKARTGPAGRWRRGCWPRGRAWWMCRPSWPPASASSMSATAARAMPPTRTPSRWRRCAAADCASCATTRTWRCCGCWPTAAMSCPAPGAQTLNRLIRHDTPGRTYYRRKIAEGQDPVGGPALPAPAHLRCGLPPARHRRRDPARRRRPGGSGRAPGDDNKTCPAWPTQPRRPALRTRHSPDPHPPRYPPPPHPPRYPPPNPLLPRQPPPAPARPRRQRGAPHRTNDVDADQAPAHPRCHTGEALTTEGSLGRASVRGSPCSIGFGGQRNCGRTLWSSRRRYVLPLPVVGERVTAGRCGRRGGWARPTAHAVRPGPRSRRAGIPRARRIARPAPPAATFGLDCVRAHRLLVVKVRCVTPLGVETASMS